MKRLPLSFPVGVIVGFALGALLLAAARHASPVGNDVVDEVQALSVALADYLGWEEKSGTKELYVRSVVANQLVPELQRLHPSIRFRNGTNRPPDSGCQSSDPDHVIVAPCERPDFVEANLIAAPLWRTFLVGIGRYNGGCEIVLVNVFSKWRIVSSQCTVF